RACPPITNSPITTISINTKKGNRLCIAHLLGNVGVARLRHLPYPDHALLFNYPQCATEV
ncbi:MAG: hypothetical protein KDI07_25745, partial [Anaerolineae bacterium]|nr:hypothetical protein [Anaerolineae bacterium]